MSSQKGFAEQSASWFDRSLLEQNNSGLWLYLWKTEVDDFNQDAVCCVVGASYHSDRHGICSIRSTNTVKCVVKILHVSRDFLAPIT